MPELVLVGIFTLHDMGLSMNEIAHMAGCSDHTVKAVLENEDYKKKFHSDVAVANLKKAFPDRIFSKCQAFLETLNPDDLKTSQAQRATIFGILFDKWRIITEKSTQIVDYRQLNSTIVDVDAKIVELEQRLKIEQ